MTYFRITTVDGVYQYKHAYDKVEVIRNWNRTFRGVEHLEIKSVRKMDDRS